jgi:hypothetical protein
MVAGEELLVPARDRFQLIVAPREPGVGAPGAEKLGLDIGRDRFRGRQLPLGPTAKPERPAADRDGGRRAQEPEKPTA